MPIRPLHITIALAFLLATAAAWAGQSATDLLKRATDLTAQIRDYSADINVNVDMPEVKMPRREAKVYFKRPDKVAVKSKGIVMVPKTALIPGSLGTTLTKDAQVTLMGTKTVNGVPLHALKIAYTGKMRSSDRLLLWIRGDRYTIERLQMQTNSRRDLDVSWEYQRVAGRYWLPRRLVARLRGQSKDAKPGTITVDFSNVRVNTGLSDSLFVPTDREKAK